MKANVLNKERIEGRVYEHNLSLKTVQNEKSNNFGKEFINGTLDVATDDKGLNIVQIRFTYVPPVFGKSGKKNNTFDVLKKIIESGKTILTDGFDDATIVRVDTALGVNDFYTERNGEETLVSAKINNGGFVNILGNATQLSPVEKRNVFEVDMLITGTELVEANEERNIKEDYLKVKGYVFDFRKAILPVEFVVKSKGGIDYFESLEASKQNPTFTKVWGNISSQTIVTKREEESAFGEPSVTEYTRTLREWVITGTSRADAVYPIGDEEAGITSADVEKAMQDREVYLAEIKKNAEDYKAKKNESSASETATASAKEGGFNF
jgi:hypothetical protein